jgi:hypothetical protein
MFNHPEIKVLQLDLAQYYVDGFPLSLGFRDIVRKGQLENFKLFLSNFNEVFCKMINAMVY